MKDKVEELLTKRDRGEGRIDEPFQGVSGNLQRDVFDITCLKI